MVHTVVYNNGPPQRQSQTPSPMWSQPRAARRPASAASPSQAAEFPRALRAWITRALLSCRSVQETGEMETAISAMIVAVIDEGTLWRKNWGAEPLPRLYHRDVSSGSVRARPSSASAASTIAEAAEDNPRIERHFDGTGQKSGPNGSGPPPPQRAGLGPRPVILTQRLKSAALPKMPPRRTTAVASAATPLRRTAGLPAQKDLQATTVSRQNVSRQRESQQEASSHADSHMGSRVGPREPLRPLREVRRELPPPLEPLQMGSSLPATTQRRTCTSEREQPLRRRDREGMRVCTAAVAVPRAVSTKLPAAQRKSVLGRTELAHLDAGRAAAERESMAAAESEAKAGRPPRKKCHLNLSLCDFQYELGTMGSER